MSAARCLVVVVAVGSVVCTAWPAAPHAGSTVDQDTRRAVVEKLDRMPLLFVPEQVSPEGAMGYVVRGRETSVWLSQAGIAYRLEQGGNGESKETTGSWVVELDLVNATPRPPVGEDPLPTKVSYFRGPKNQWRTGLPSYATVRYHEPWPGIDVVVSGTAGELESTFVVRPGADPGQIRLAYRGADAVRFEADGSLVVDTPLGEIRELAPFAYQEIEGERVKVAAAFELAESTAPGPHSYRFKLGDYNPTQELVVDPVTLVYCGFIGGEGFDISASAIAADSDGRAYVAGSTSSTQASFPVAVGPDRTYNDGELDAFVARVNSAGTALDYCGYIGGSGTDGASGIAVDSAGRAYVTGSTDSDEASFPTAIGPDLTFNGPGRDAFVAEINASGTGLVYCGYIGGSNYEDGLAIGIDSEGSAFIVGSTQSTETSFPVTVGPDLTYNGGDNSGDGFVAKVNAVGTGLHYCGYIGGADNDSAEDIAVDAAGHAYITGWTGSSEATFPVAVGPDLTYNGDLQDAFVAKVNPAGAALDYCGYIGGSENDFGGGIAVDGAGNAYITGHTESDEHTFPVRVGPDLTYNGGGFPGDAFVARLNAAGTAVDYCGYIGGSGRDDAACIAADSSHRALVAGYTDSDESTFPVVDGPDLTYNGSRDAFVARINAGGTALDCCGYIGGSDREGASGIAVDHDGNAYIVGGTSSTEATFPVTTGPDLTFNGTESQDVFVAKLIPPDGSAEIRSFVPAAAVASGAEGAFFQTDLEVNNKGSNEAQVMVQWLPRNQDNSEPLQSEPITLAAGQSLRYENVLNALFGLEPDAVGALAMVADSADVIGMSRTCNVPGAKIAGTFGQGLPAIPSDQLIPSAQVERIIFMSENDDTRANVGCVNGRDTQVRITLELYDGEGTLLEVRNMNLGPWSNNQINRIFGDHAPVDGYVDVSSQTEGAAFYCYGSVLDNLTSDPTTVLPQTTSGATLFIPAAALAAGLEGAFFQTDLDLNNAGGTAASYQLGWLPRGESNAEPLMSGSFTLAAGASVRYENALAGVFGLEPDQVGGLVVEADTEDLLAMSRTYNVPGAKVAGTFGQELPGVTSRAMIPTGVKKRIIFMNENDDVRSNVGCQNAGLEAATVKVELHDSTGAVLGTKTMQLPPMSNDQITRAFRDFAPISAGYVDVWTTTAGASIYCYGSVLDNSTSDPTTVLPQ